MEHPKSEKLFFGNSLLFFICFSSSSFSQFFISASSSLYLAGVKDKRINSLWLNCRMSTWELYPDSSGDGFRWEVSGRILQSDSDSTPTKALESTALPSMSDLLIQGCSRLIELEEATNEDVPMFRTGLGKSVSLKESSIARAKSILGDDMVDYSVQHHSGTPGQYEDHGKRSEIVNQSFKVPPTMFQTAGGKSLSVSAEALKRARNLLGDPELGTLFDDIAADDQFLTTPKDKKFGDIGINDGSRNTSKIHKSNSFVSPLRSSSKQFRSVKLGNLHSGSNLIEKFDAAVDEKDCTLSITKLAARGLWNNGHLESDRVVDNSKENGFLPRAKQLGRPAGQPLVDITNCSDIAFANSKQDCTQKKRLGTRVSVAPFKRPRISSFKTPLKNNAQQAASGKEVGVPLDFNCIKCSGGPVPETLAGITRIYPILYKERLGEKKSIVRSQKMESRVNQLHTQRRLALVEGLMSEYDRGINGIHSQDDTDCEGAKVFKLLETVTEPELLVADMSMEQLKSYSTYKAKFEAAMQIEMEKSVTKALEDAGLGERNVTPFMRTGLLA